MLAEDSELTFEEGFVFRPLDQDFALGVEFDFFAVVVGRLVEGDDGAVLAPEFLVLNLDVEDVSGEAV